MTRLAAPALLAALTLALGPACSRSEPGAGSPAPAEEGQLPVSILPADDATPLPEVPSPYDALHPAVRGELDKPFTGDFDEMVKRRLIRAGIVYNRTQYFIDKGIQKGVAYESIKLFEEQVNKRLKTGLMKVSVTVVPLTGTS